MIPVFEPELWGVSPLIPDGKTPTRWGGGASAAKSTPASGTAPAAGGGSASGKTSKDLKLWDGGSFDFHDILDIINPLQHLPIINSIYRSEVKDEIGAVPRILGSMLYGGGVVGALIGAASAVVNIVIEHETGKDLGQHIYTAIFGEGAGTRRTTEIAAPKTGGAAAGVAKTAEATASGTEKTGVSAAAAAVAAAAKTATAAAPGAKPISSKADAALQAFVAGLSKNASPAAAAAANAAIAKRALRVTGSAASAAGVLGRTGKISPPSKGEISTQFHRADWYQRNQAILKAQAAALAKRQSGAANATKSGGKDAKSAAAILHLFTAPVGALAKTTKSAPAKTAAPTPAATGAPVELVPTKPTVKRGPVNRAGVAGPWMVNEIASGLSKYETLVKARKAGATAQ